MDKIFKPLRFDADPAAVGAERKWLHWIRSFSHYLTVIEPEADKLATLVNHVAPDVFTLFAECDTYDGAIDVLQALYVKTKNEVYARHLATRRQEAGETLDQYVQVLVLLSRDCNFRAVSAEELRQSGKPSSRAYARPLFGSAYWRQRSPITLWP